MACRKCASSFCWDCMETSCLCRHKTTRILTSARRLPPVNPQVLIRAVARVRREAFLDKKAQGETSDDRSHVIDLVYWTTEILVASNRTLKYLAVFEYSTSRFRNDGFWSLADRDARSQKRQRREESLRSHQLRYLRSRLIESTRQLTDFLLKASSFDQRTRLEVIDQTQFIDGLIQKVLRCVEEFADEEFFRRL
jgi:hypothetical protein